MLRKHRALRSAALLGPSALKAPQGSAEAGATYLNKRHNENHMGAARAALQTKHGFLYLRRARNE